MYGIAYIGWYLKQASAMKLINHIKQHRARLELTQQELAERVGVRRQTIIAVEKLQYVPSALLAFKIARALGMKVDELFQLVEDKKKRKKK
jgi:putative transcriptional regulator